MKNKRMKVPALLLGAALLLSACAGTGQDAAQGEQNGDVGQLSSGMLDPGYTERDLDGTWDDAAAVHIVCDGAQAQIDAKGAYADSGVVTVTAAGTFVFSGALSGQIVVDAQDAEKVQLVLNGAAIACADGPGIYIKSADKVFLTLADGTQNSVGDGAVYMLAADGDEPDAAIFSKDDLTINGSGALTVSGNCDKGIHSKDDLKITGGTISVTAAGDGVKGRDCVAVCGGTLTVDAGGDGIQSNNDEDAGRGWVSIDGGTVAVTAGLDGIQAQTTLQITAGTLAVTAGGGAGSGVVSQTNGFGDGFSGFGGGSFGAAPPDSAGQQTPPDGMGAQTPPDVQSGATATQGEPPDATQGETPTAAQGESPDAAQTTTAAGGDSFKGLKGTGCIYICGGSVTVDAADDAVHSNGDVTVTDGSLLLASGDDGIHADGALLISGGSVTVTGSYEGLEGQTVTVSGGAVEVTATDDGINAAGGSDTAAFGGRGQDSFSSDGASCITVSGGTLHIVAGGDGIDSNGDLVFTGGVTLVDGPTDDGNGPLDYAGSGTISGGVLIAAGSAGMAQSLSSDAQGVILAKFSQQSGGTRVSVLDGAGKAVLTYTPSKAYVCAVVSAPALAQGESYTLVSGGEAPDADAYGFAQDTALTGTTSALCSVTMSALCETAGAAESGGMMSGGPGGNKNKRG